MKDFRVDVKPEISLWLLDDLKQFASTGISGKGIPLNVHSRNISLLKTKFLKIF